MKDLSTKWIAAEMAIILCEVITFLQEDPHYSKEDAAQRLDQLWSYIDRLWGE